MNYLLTEMQSQLAAKIIKNLYAKFPHCDLQSVNFAFNSLQLEVEIRPRRYIIVVKPTTGIVVHEVGNPHAVVSPFARWIKGVLEGKTRNDEGRLSG